MYDTTGITDIFLETHFYKSHALKVRKSGETGWSVHIFAPKNNQLEREIAILSMENVDLASLLKKAEVLVDVGMDQD